MVGGKDQTDQESEFMAVADGFECPITVHAVDASPPRSLSSRNSQGQLCEEQARAADRSQGLRLRPTRRAARSRRHQDDHPIPQGIQGAKDPGQALESEAAFARLGNFQRLMVRYEWRPENYLSFVQLGWALILLRSIDGARSG